MIASAVDNAIGPLSMIAAPVNFTRDLSLKYPSPVKGSFSHIVVRAVLTEKKDRRLFFSAEVMSPGGAVSCEREGNELDNRTVCPGESLT